MDSLLSKQECAIGRGLAIVCIMLHNYCHAFDFAIQESEFNFALDQSLRWGDYLHHIDGNFLINVFSTWGIYSLPLFFFLAGYGLVLKYESAGAAAVKPLSFVWQHYRKLLCLMVIPLAIFVVMQLAVAHRTDLTPVGLVLQLTTLVNWFPQYHIVPGPYWFLGAIMQIYVLYLVLYYCRKGVMSWMLPLLLAVGGFVAHVVVPGESVLAGWMRYNFPVALLPFAMGLVAARYGVRWRLNTMWTAVTLVLASVLLIAFSFNYVLWGLNYGIAIVACISMVKLVGGRMAQVMVQIGTLSSLLYVIHPIVRWAVMGAALKLGRMPHIEILIYLTVTAVAVMVYKKLRLDELASKIIK